MMFTFRFGKTNYELCRNAEGITIQIKIKMLVISISQFGSFERESYPCIYISNMLSKENSRQYY